jgi:hypothetical protein
MCAKLVMAETIDADDKALLRLGGICAIVLGVAYIVTFPLYAQVGVPPIGGQAWMEYLAGKTTVWWAILGLSVLTDLLFVPFACALYVALRAVHRNAMLLATALVGLFVVIDLAVTWTNFGALLTLSADHAAATTDAQRAAYVAAANYASAVLPSRLERVYAILILSMSILVIGVVMQRGVFGRMTAYLAIATGLLGVAAQTGSGVFIILNAVLATIWILVSGFRLRRLARR